MFSRLLGCRTPEQVREVLSVQASEYWTTHYLPGRRSRYSVKSFGDMMLDNLTINLVAPMMFTYGHVTSDEGLKEAAVDLLEKTKPENNVYIRGWKSRGVEAESAFFHARAAAIVERILREKTLRRMQYRQEDAVLSIKNTKFTRSFSKH